MIFEKPSKRTNVSATTNKVAVVKNWTGHGSASHDGEEIEVVRALELELLLVCANIGLTHPLPGVGGSPCESSLELALHVLNLALDLLVSAHCSATSLGDLIGNHLALLKLCIPKGMTTAVVAVVRIRQQPVEQDANRRVRIVGSMLPVLVPAKTAGVGFGGGHGKDGKSRGWRVARKVHGKDGKSGKVAEVMALFREVTAL